MMTNPAWLSAAARASPKPIASTRIPAAGSSCDTTTATIPATARLSAMIRGRSSGSRPSATFATATMTGYV